jgi:thiol-disulfide isomerase/thioredoxin
MKNILLLFCSFFLLFLVSCSSEPGYYSIEGNIDTKDGLKVYRIIANSNNQPQIVDSTTIEKNKFLMEGKAINPSISFIKVEGFNFNLPIIIEEGKIKVKMFKDSIGSSKISGTTSNDHFNDYKYETKKFVKTINEIKSEIQLASQNGNNELIIDLQNDYNLVQTQIHEYEVEFLKRNFDSYLSVILLERFVSSKKVISTTEAKNIFNLFTERIKGSDIGERLSSIFNNPDQPIEVGNFAPNFNAPTPDGQMLNLNDKLGKVTLLEFWASWCGPCRRENPNLVKIYKKFNNKGFEIIGVSLDKSKPQWIRAIADDYLTWNHVSNLKFWQDPIAKLYKVKAIPVSFILDEKGIIVAKNLRGSQLEAKVSELLNVK